LQRNLPIVPGSVKRLWHLLLLLLNSNDLVGDPLEVLVGDPSPKDHRILDHLVQIHVAALEHLLSRRDLPVVEIAPDPPPPEQEVPGNPTRTFENPTTVPPGNLTGSAMVGGRLMLYKDQWLRMCQDSWVQRVVSQGYLLEFTSPPPRDTPVRPTPLPVDYIKRSVLLEEVDKLLAKNAIKKIFPPYSEGFWSTFFLAPKKTGDWRPILNLKPLNVGRSETSFSGVLGSLDRLEGCLPPCSHPQLTPQVAEVYDGRSSILLQESPIRPVDSTQSLHEDCQVLSRDSQAQGCDYIRLSGRLAHLSPKPGPGDPSFTAGTRSVTRPRVYRELGEIETRSDPSSDLPGRGAGPYQSSSKTFYGEGQQSDRVRSVDDEGYTGPSYSLAQVAGIHGQHGGLSTILPTQDEVHAATTSKAVLTSGALHLPQDSYVPVCHGGPSLVVSQTQSYCRQVFSDLTSSSSGGLRCVINRLGGAHGDALGQRYLESQGDCSAYQHARNDGCSANSLAVRASGIRQEGPSQVRQLDSRVLYQQAGRDKVPFSVSTNKSHMALVYRQGNDFVSGPHSRSGERNCGHSVQMGQGQAYRMDSGEASFSGAATQQEIHVHRSLCLQNQSSAAGILFPSTRSSCSSSECSQYPMDRNGCLCLPASVFDSPSIEKNIGRGLRSSSGSSILAKTVMVSVASSTSRGCTAPPSTISGPIEDAGITSQVSQRRESSIDCLDAVSQRFQKKGFSKKSAELVAQGRRESTRRIYASRLRFFYEWCDARKVSPTQASVPDIADFLRNRFESGIQSSTVRNYLSAINAIHVGTEDGPISKNADLKLLIDGMANVRPKVRNIWPSWDLPKVLQSLRGLPFEPIQSASLRDLSLKTCFLIAITSGRRCSELHALTIGSSIVFSRAGVTLYFNPGFLAKNERNGFSASPLFLPVLSRSDDRAKRINCPVRALHWYIDKTKTIRSKVNQLFITSRSPYKAAAKATMANWLVDVIIRAKASSSSEARPGAHSVRAYSASWAFSQGLSIREIMNAVCWKSDNTFTNTYLKHLGPTLDHGRYALAILHGAQQSL